MFGLALLGFFLIGPVGGILFAVLSLGLVLMIAAQPGRRVDKPGSGGGPPTR